MNARKFYVFVSALVAMLICTAWGGTASAQVINEPDDQPQGIMNGSGQECPSDCLVKIGNLDKKIDACCEKKTEPPPKPKPFHFLCGDGTVEYRDNGNSVAPLAHGKAHCTCVPKEDGEAEKMLVMGILESDRRIEVCVPKEAVDKAYVDALADDMVSAEAFIDYKNRINRDFAVVRKSLLKILANVAKLKLDVSDLKRRMGIVEQRLDDHEERLDAIESYFITLGILVGGGGRFRGGAGAGDAHLGGEFTANLTSVVGITANARIGVGGAQTVDGVEGLFMAGIGPAFFCTPWLTIELLAEGGQEFRAKAAHPELGNVGQFPAGWFGGELAAKFKPVQNFFIRVAGFAGGGPTSHEYPGGTDTRTGLQAGGVVELGFEAGVLPKAREASNEKKTVQQTEPEEPDAEDLLDPKLLKEIDDLGKVQVHLKAGAKAESRHGSVPPPPTDRKPSPGFEHDPSDK